MLTSASQLHAEFEPIRSIMPSSLIHWALNPLTLHQLALKERLLKSKSLISRVRKIENFLDSKIFVAKTSQIKRMNCINFQNRSKGGFARFYA